MNAPRTALLASFLLAALPLAFAAHADSVLLENGLIHTQGPAGSLKGGSVLIVDGRIRAIGEHLSAPAGTRVVDLKGRPVTPALFGGLGQLGVLEVSEESVTDDSTLHLGQMRPEFDPSYAFNPDSVPVSVARVDGVGFAVLVPGASAGAKGAPGSSILHGLASLTSTDGRGPRTPLALSVTLGQDASPLAGDSRAAAYMLLSQALQEARGGQTAPGEQRLLTSAGRRVLARFIAEQRPFLIELDRAADIRTAVAFAAREKLRIMIVGGAEAWRVAPLLASAHIPVVLNPLDDLPESFDQIGATLQNAARLQAAGVTLAFTLRASPHDARKLRQAAGIAVANGLPWAAGLAAITTTPAELFGATAEFGSLAVGAPANLVVWSGDPLEVTSVVEAQWLDGHERSLRTRQTELRDRYLEKLRAGRAR
jgi:imidazolonepropionase-like amidohydrolase